MKKSNKFNAGLGFGAIMAVFFILQNLFSKDDFNAKNIFLSIILGLSAGAVSGLIYGWLMGLFFKSKFGTQHVNFLPNADELVLFETGANHFKGLEGVGGKLYLTNSRLVFKSHNFNIQNHEISLPLAGIRKIERYKPGRLVNNGLSITSSNGIIEKFVVEQPEHWLNQLKLTTLSTE